MNSLPLKSNMHLLTLKQMQEVFQHFKTVEAPPIIEIWLTSWLRDVVFRVRTDDKLLSLLFLCGYSKGTEEIYFMGEELFADLASDIFAACIPVFRPRGIRVTEGSYAPPPTQTRTN